MQANRTIKTLSAAVLAFTAMAPIASYANANARAIDSYNESSEPAFLESTTAPLAQVTKASHTVADARAVDAVNESSEPAFLQSNTAHVAQGKKAPTMADARAIDSVNEGNSTIGD